MNQKVTVSKLFLEHTIRQHKKVCCNYIRGCRIQLDLEYKFSKCQECLQKDRKKDHERRQKVKDDLKQISVNVEEKACTACFITYPLSEYNGEKRGVITKTCKKCRNSNKKQDLLRDKQHRLELSRIADQKLEIRYNRCKKSAKHRNYIFELDIEQYYTIVKNPCNYCGIIDENKIYNTIDRVDSSIGYIYTNCVSCCIMCNSMKGSLDIYTFLERVEHIVSFNNLMENETIIIRHPNSFSNSTMIKYYYYKQGALYRKLDYILSPEQFEEIIRNNCYICGKQNIPGIHQNGIDRKDNSMGYILDNCYSCCSECNYMKNVFNYNDLLDKLLLIYKYQRQTNKTYSFVVERRNTTIIAKKK